MDEWEKKVRENLAIVLAKGRCEVHECQILFDLYNERRAELTGDPNASREIAPHCSGCIARVVERLKTYIDKQNASN